MNCNRHRHHVYSRLVFLVISCLVMFSAAALAANSPAEDTFEVARVGREFKLKAGHQVPVKGTKLRIRFVSVENDSRCPADVTCVWAGNAAAQFQLGTGSRGKKLTLNTSKASSFAGEVTYQGYKVKLIELSPYPRTDRKIKPRDYSATLLVSKE